LLIRKSENHQPTQPKNMNEKNIIQVRRPTGKIEEVDISIKFPFITAETFAKLVAHNKALGTEVIGFVSGGIGVAKKVDTGAFRRSRAAYARVIGGSLSEDDDISANRLCK